jgi:hypothetical protein
VEVITLSGGSQPRRARSSASLEPSELRRLGAVGLAFAGIAGLRFHVIASNVGLNEELMNNVMRPRIRFFTEWAWGCQRSLSTPSDTSLSPEELERLKEILKQINRPFYYELQRPAAKRPEPEEEEEEEEEEEGKKEENEEEDEQQEPWRLT